MFRVGIHESWSRHSSHSCHFTSIAVFLIASPRHMDIDILVRSQSTSGMSSGEIQGMHVVIRETYNENFIWISDSKWNGCQDGKMLKVHTLQDSYIVHCAHQTLTTNACRYIRPCKIIVYEKHETKSVVVRQRTTFPYGVRQHQNHLCGNPFSLWFPVSGDVFPLYTTQNRNMCDLVNTRARRADNATVAYVLWWHFRYTRHTLRFLFFPRILNDIQTQFFSNAQYGRIFVGSRQSAVGRHTWIGFSE